MNKIFKYFLIFLSFLLVVVPIVFAIILFKTSQGAFEHSFNNSDSARKSNLRDSKVNASKEPISILFLGIDENDNRKKNGQSTEHSRTDSMILSTLNTKKKQIRMLSIPRDTISYIPKVGYYDKMTHAHAYGGPAASMDSVEATLNVPVDYYARINMKAFVDAVDELGGINFDVPYSISEPNMNDTGKTKVKKGYQKLNGEEALAVARTRHQDSDLKRGQRQMQLLEALFAKAQKSDSFNKLDDVIKLVGKNSKHNLSYKEIRALASVYLKKDVNIKTTQLKGNDDYLSGVYYYNPDIKNIQDTSNTLRKDLNLSKITNKNDFLNQRVIDHYGDLVPQTQIDKSLLRKNQNDTTDDDASTDDNNNQSNSDDNSDSNQQNYDQNQQQDPQQSQQPNADPNQQQDPQQSQQPNADPNQQQDSQQSQQPNADPNQQQDPQQSQQPNADPNQQQAQY
ncbi:LCP family protein [Staphylococcus durrellii]|uniref:LCP family protein n=1 Tax=Staphylococcus durrellii TaxID=2781773 RepID=UPI00189F9283|nr:LCP family protein [Staphylococcus durrellii]MBF7017454.1 LCP family protein [Staphylococcus durrellii]